MSRYNIAAILCTFCLMVYGDTVEQSDWSSGPGESGPAAQWGSSFDLSLNVNWADDSGNLFLQTGSEEHLIAEDFGNASFLACADFNNDGLIDIACASYADHQLAWFENLGGGNSWTEHLIEVYLPYACVLSTADIDKDGLPDLMCASEGGDGICWWRNNNWAESWTKTTVDSTCPYPFSMEAMDFDGDDDTDLCAALYGMGEITWYSNDDSAGTEWTKHVIRDVFPAAWWAVPADFNGDDNPDVAGARHAGEINWWENDGTGEFPAEHSIATGYAQCTTIRNCDLNGDGNPDVAACSNAGRIAWWENSVQGEVWTEHIIDEDLQGSWSLWVEDIDVDGDQDVVGNDRAGDFVYWYENLDGNGTLWMRWLLDQGMDMSNDVNAADLDNDGFPDPIATFGGDNTIYWWKLNGQFQPQGSLQSTILDMGQDAEWGEIVWSCTEPPDTEVQISVRAADTVEELGAWVQIPESGTDLSAYIPDNSRYFQYRIGIASASGSESPMLADVSVGWIPMGVSQGSHERSVLGLPFPNPVTGLVTIAVSSGISSEGQIRIFDQSGRCVSASRISEGVDFISADCSDFPDGVYHITLIENNVVSSEEFAILR